MKNFKTIETKNTKFFKLQKEKTCCDNCRQKIDFSGDYFQLNLNWKIKKKPDVKNFCSIVCLKHWCEND